MIPFTKPSLVGNEFAYLDQVLKSSKWAGDGAFSKKCEAFLEQKYGLRKTLLTTSCTDALELAAILFDIRDGDEVIVPAFTFVSTVNAFILRGATIKFVDSAPGFPNLDLGHLESLITKRTKAVVPVHYAGVCCDMTYIMELAEKHAIFVVEDAAQAVDAYYHERPAGSFGHLGAFSFHDTKNIVCGEGGAIVINDERFLARAEIVREKGTNRSAFFRGEVDKYGWVDVGSSFLPSELNAAVLLAQFEKIEQVTRRRLEIWNRYAARLGQLKNNPLFSLMPQLPNRRGNGHMFFLICQNLSIRTALVSHLKERSIQATFHYQTLSESTYAKNHGIFADCPQARLLSDCLLRLPLFFELTDDEVDQVCSAIEDFARQPKISAV